MINGARERGAAFQMRQEGESRWGEVGAEGLMSAILSARITEIEQALDE